jgi:hypothetical protein
MLAWFSYCSPTAGKGIVSKSFAPTAMPVPPRSSHAQPCPRCMVVCKCQQWKQVSAGHLEERSMDT